jgi:hypothetical protein
MRLKQTVPLFTFLFLQSMHAMRFGRGTHPSPPSAPWVLPPPSFGLCEARSVFCESWERSLKLLSVGALDLPAGILSDVGGTARAGLINKRSSSQSSDSHRGQKGKAVNKPVGIGRNA